MGVDEARAAEPAHPDRRRRRGDRATICVPDRDARTAALGERLAAAIEAAHRRAPAGHGRRALAGGQADGTIIALGNLNDNVVIERLYWNKYLEIDALSRPAPGRICCRWCMSLSTGRAA
jgi:hypothetical protein